jgi:ubiquinone/menaquinone biosynthesis C-methylase UbiE
MKANGRQSAGADSPAPFGPELASRYDHWLETPAGMLAQRLQHRLLLSLLDPKWGESVLDVGCGTGETLRRLSDAGLRVAGLDRSPAMLAVARSKLGSVPLFAGDATCLPFDDASFDAAILDTTIEFVDDPLAAVRELTRVTRRRVYVGVLNRWSLLAARRRVEARWRPSLYGEARFFTFYEVIAMLAAAKAARWRWGAVPYVPGRLSARSTVQQIAAGVSGVPNPFAAYLGFSADVEKLEGVLRRVETRIRVVAPPEAAIARSGVRRALGRQGTSAWR